MDSQVLVSKMCWFLTLATRSELERRCLQRPLFRTNARALGIALKHHGVDKNASHSNPISKQQDTINKWSATHQPFTSSRFRHKLMSWWKSAHLRLLKAVFYGPEVGTFCSCVPQHTGFLGQYHERDEPLKWLQPCVSECRGARPLARHEPDTFEFADK